MGFLYMKKLHIALLAGMFITIVCSNLLMVREDYNDLQSSVLRLHILANSDSSEDQEMKLAVRDAILAASDKIFPERYHEDNCLNAEMAAAAAMSEITELAQTVVSDFGSSYTVSCELVKMSFPEKSYESITFPSGLYDALRVVIGQGEGKNWWCVMFPSLCLSPALQENDEILQEFLAESFTEQEMKMLQEPQQYYVRFKLVELLEKLEKWLESHFLTEFTEKTGN